MTFRIQGGCNRSRRTEFRRAVFSGFLLVCSVTPTSSVASILTACTADLIADGGSEISAVHVGEVTVSTTGDGSWEVEYSTTGVWEITQAHLEVACSIDAVPQTLKGNPKVGQFCAQDSPEATQSYAFAGVSPQECHGASCDCVTFAAHAVVVDSSSCADAIIFGTERFSGDLYQIDVATSSAVKISSTGPFSPDDQNQPNGAAYDPVNQRLYYSAQGVEGSKPSDLFFYDLLAGTENFAGSLAAFDVGGAFHAGDYYYIPNGTDDLYLVTLNGDGTIASEAIVFGDFTGTSKVYRFGDIAISSAGILYGSTNASSGSSAEFFSIDLTTGTYERICGDEKSIPSCVHSLQLAFGSDGVLYAHSAGTGDFFSVDVTTGEGIAAGVVNGGSLFTDLASGALCEPVTETAWGDGSGFPGKSWATYFQCGNCP